MNKMKILCVLCVGLYMGFAFADSEEYTQCNYINDLSTRCRGKDSECKSPHVVICNPTNNSEFPNFYKTRGLIETTTPLERIVFTVKREGEVEGIRTYEMDADTFRVMYGGNALTLSKEALVTQFFHARDINVNADDINIVSFNVAKDTPLYADVNAKDKQEKVVGQEIKCEYVQKKAIDLGSLPRTCMDLLASSNQCRITGKCLATISCVTEMYNPENPALFSEYSFEQDIICSARESFKGHQCPPSVEECISDTSVGMQTMAQDEFSSDEQKVIIKEIRTRTKGRSGGVQ